VTQPNNQYLQTVQEYKGILHNLHLVTHPKLVQSIRHKPRLHTQRRLDIHHNTLPGIPLSPLPGIPLSPLPGIPFSPLPGIPISLLLVIPYNKVILVTHSKGITNTKGMPLLQLAIHHLDKGIYNNLRGIPPPTPIQLLL
jgi:hypothetical protein